MVAKGKLWRRRKARRWSGCRRKVQKYHAMRQDACGELMWRGRRNSHTAAQSALKVASRQLALGKSKCCDCVSTRPVLTSRLPQKGSRYDHPAHGGSIS